MLINFQFPVFDLRSFTEEDNRLVSPTWPSPSCTEFIRAFGGIKHKYEKTTEELNHTKICNARRAVRFQPYFDTSLKLFHMDPKGNSNLKLKYRRYYFDGYSAGKYEFGFKTTSPYINKSFNADIDEFINGFLDLNIKLYVPSKEPLDVRLSEFNKQFPIVLPFSTSSIEDVKAQNINEKLFLKGTPLVLMQFTKEENFPQPVKMTKVTVKELDAELYHKFYKYDGCSFQIIMFRIEGERKNNAMKSFLIYLSQIYYLKETLYGLLKATQRKIINPDVSDGISNLYQEYLTEKIRFLKKKSAGLDNQLLDIALSTSDLIEQGPREELLRYLKRVLCIRPNIYKNIERTLDLFELANGKKETEIEKTVYNIGNIQIDNSTTYNDFDLVFKDFKSKVDWQRLIDELIRLKNAKGIKQEDSRLIEEAISETKEGNGRTIWKYLSKVGKYCLDVAKDIGVDVASSVIKKSLGVG